MPQTLHPVVERWFAYLAQRNRSPATLRAYRETMQGYHPDPLKATVDEVDVWWARQDHLAAASRSRALSCVRSFYRWATKWDLIIQDPTRRLDPPTQGKRLPHPIGRQDLRTVMDAAEPDLRRALALGAYGGLRVAEAAAVMWRDVDQESRRIIVRSGKGDKDRAVGLSPLLLDELLPDAGGNVVSGLRKGYSGAQLQRRVNRHIERHAPDYTFHNLRARYATVALAKTGNLLAVSRALGHASPSTTASYAAASDSDLDLIAVAVTE